MNCGKCELNKVYRGIDISNKFEFNLKWYCSGCRKLEKDCICDDR